MINGMFTVTMSLLICCGAVGVFNNLLAYLAMAWSQDSGYIDIPHRCMDSQPRAYPVFVHLRDYTLHSINSYSMSTLSVMVSMLVCFIYSWIYWGYPH